ncbi:hypothetical protein SAMN06272759_1591, partial [Novosphingobium sp. B1]
MEITTIGLDLAKNVFQIHAVDANGVNRRPIGTPYRRAKGTPWRSWGSLMSGAGFA